MCKTPLLINGFTWLYLTCYTFFRMLFNPTSDLGCSGTHQSKQGVASEPNLPLPDCVSAEHPQGFYSSWFDDDECQLSLLEDIP